jgi:DNA-binding transcriptional regulator/RsmH inhibitor MraZ
MFQGAAALNLDAKGRMAVPARHRDALVRGRRRTPGGDRPSASLPAALSPVRPGSRSATRSSPRPSLQVESAMVRRLLVGFAEDVELDGAGRLLISPSLRQYAGLEKEIWLVGQGTPFRNMVGRRLEGAAGGDLCSGRQAPAAGPGKPCTVSVDSHASVLLPEAVAALAIRPAGTHVDATFGRGGHSRAILAALGPAGRLIALDRDPAAIAAGAALSDPRFTLAHAAFSEFGSVRCWTDAGHCAGGRRADGLGVSSPQLDDGGAGH